MPLFHKPGLSFLVQQYLTEAQKYQARRNISVPWGGDDDNGNAFRVRSPFETDAAATLSFESAMGDDYAYLYVDSDEKFNYGAGNSNTSTIHTQGVDYYRRRIVTASMATLIDEAVHDYGYTLQHYSSDFNNYYRHTVSDDDGQIGSFVQDIDAGVYTYQQVRPYYEQIFSTDGLGYAELYVEGTDYAIELTSYDGANSGYLGLFSPQINLSHESNNVEQTIELSAAAIMLDRQSYDDGNNNRSTITLGQNQSAPWVGTLRLQSSYDGDSAIAWVDLRSPDDMTLTMYVAAQDNDSYVKTSMDPYDRVVRTKINAPGNSYYTFTEQYEQDLHRAIYSSDLDDFLMLENMQPYGYFLNHWAPDGSRFYCHTVSDDEGYIKLDVRDYVGNYEAHHTVYQGYHTLYASNSIGEVVVNLDGFDKEIYLQANDNLTASYIDITANTVAIVEVFSGEFAGVNAEIRADAAKLSLTRDTEYASILNNSKIEFKKLDAYDIDTIVLSTYYLDSGEVSATAKLDLVNSDGNTELITQYSADNSYQQLLFNPYTPSILASVRGADFIDSITETAVGFTSSKLYLSDSTAALEWANSINGLGAGNNIKKHTFGIDAGTASLYMTDNDEFDAGNMTYRHATTWGHTSYNHGVFMLQSNDYVQVDWDVADNPYSLMTVNSEGNWTSTAYTYSNESIFRIYDWYNDVNVIEQYMNQYGYFINHYSSDGTRYYGFELSDDDSRNALVLYAYGAGNELVQHWDRTLETINNSDGHGTSQVVMTRGTGTDGGYLHPVFDVNLTQTYDANAWNFRFNLDQTLIGWVLSSIQNVSGGHSTSITQQSLGTTTIESRQDKDSANIRSWIRSSKTAAFMETTNVSIGTGRLDCSASQVTQRYTPASGPVQTTVLTKNGFTPSAVRYAPTVIIFSETEWTVPPQYSVTWDTHTYEIFCDAGDLEMLLPEITSDHWGHEFEFFLIDSSHVCTLTPFSGQLISQNPNKELTDQGQYVSIRACSDGNWYLTASLIP